MAAHKRLTNQAGSRMADWEMVVSRRARALEGAEAREWAHLQGLRPPFVMQGAT